MKFRDEVPEAGGSFLKLKDKESVVGVFAGDIHEFFAIWEGGKMTVAKEGDAGAGFRFRLNFIVKTPTGYQAKILEQGATVYRELKNLNEEYDLDKTVIKITRSGSTRQNTSYSFLPLLKASVGPEVKAVPLLELAKMEGKGDRQAAPASTGEDWSSSPEFNGMPDEEEIPF